MAKVKRKEVTLWCAGISDGIRRPKHICTHPVRVLESAKQYRVIKDDPDNEKASRTIGYASIVNKCDNDRLFLTEREALEALDKVLTRKEQIATRRANEAQEDLFLVTEALENHVNQ